MALTAKTRNVGNITIVDLDGRITLGESTGVLRDTLRSLVNQGNKNIVLNLERVSYVDSSGLGELVGAYTTIANQGGALKLLNLQSKTNDLMQITKLHTIFPIYNDEKQAVESFGQKASV